MSKNYVLAWAARGLDSGNYYSMLEPGTRQGSERLHAAILAWQAAHPAGTIDLITPVYFLIDKNNVIALLKTTIAHYPSMLASQWAFFQDGLVPRTTPSGRKRKGWWRIDDTYWP